MRIGVRPVLQLGRSGLAWIVRHRTGLLAAALLLAPGWLWVRTAPPILPTYRSVVAQWQPSEAWLYDRNGHLLDSVRIDFQTRRLAWTRLDGIAPELRRLVVDAEDRRFFDHGGIDWLAVASALRSRMDGSRSRGASTITMQLAGYLEPGLARPGSRSWLDKLRQARTALAIERNWDKREILEAYFNLAGYRGEAQGVAAATLSLFGKPPDAIAPHEAALVTALLPSPGASPERLAARACRLAPQLDCAIIKSAATDMASERRSLSLDPGLAPHLAARLLDKPGLRVETRLDRDVQRLATVALRRQMLALGPDRARDGAVIVVDNASGDVLAYVGGVGGDSTAAYVDGASALRQAGSTLKPFLYAMAIEKGYLTAASILDDSPVQLDTASGLYVPRNYDEVFKGPVSARMALAASLNIPAVRTLLLVTPDAFRDRLWDSGYASLTEDGQYYGYSLALGSAEVTLLEQAAAYRSLARGGMSGPIRLTSDISGAADRPVLDPGAAWIVGNILSDPIARASTFGLDSALKLPFWAAAKTGTSKAMRDNWCIGWTDRFTVAVWVGNLEGDSMKAVSGTSGAAPIWRDIMLGLHRDRPSQPPPAPRGLESRRVAFTGVREAARREWFLPGTGQALFSPAPAAAHRPHITNPVSGSVFALDPDIPKDRQRIVVEVSGEVSGHRLMLGRHALGPANGRPQILAGPGAHRIALVDAQGKTVDQVLFTIR